MSDQSDVETEVVPTKKQISEAQRKARIENLKKGRITRQKNLDAKKSAQAKKESTKSYKVEQSSSDESDSSDSDSSEDELVIAHKRKKPKKDKASKPDNSVSNEIKELRELMVASLAKQKKKKRSTKTIINVPGYGQPPPKQTNQSDFYKTKLLQL